MTVHHDIDPEDRPDPIELADLVERPTRDEVEPHDFDDRRIADRYGVRVGGFFAHETYDIEEPF